MKTRNVTFNIQLHYTHTHTHTKNELTLQLFKLFNQFSACPSTETKKVVPNYGSHQGRIVAASM